MRHSCSTCDRYAILWMPTIPALLTYNKVTFLITGSFATLVQPSQANWNNASQKRVAKTSSILGNIKWLKMCGLTGDAFAMLHDARVYELKVSERFRKLLCAIVILGSYDLHHLPAIGTIHTRLGPS